MTKRLKEIFGTIWALFIGYLIAMALWGDAILKFIKELFLLLLIIVILVGIIFLVIWYFFLKNDRSSI